MNTSALLRRTTTQQHAAHESKIKIALTATTFTAISLLLYKPLSKYGIQGTLRLIWEGDAVPPHIRDQLDKLDVINSKLLKQSKKLKKIKTTIEMAKLNSVDGEVDEIEDVDSTSPKRHYILIQIPSLEKDLGMLSYTLDQIAAEIDELNSHSDADLRQQKKDMSKRVVEMMNLCDSYLKECGVESSQDF